MYIYIINTYIYRGQNVVKYHVLAITSTDILRIKSGKVNIFFMNLVRFIKSER